MQKAGFTRILFGTAAFAVAASALAEGTLRVRDARAIATVPGQSVAAAYMTIASPSARGPVKGRPVMVGSGMGGDRAHVVFASPGEISSFIRQACQ